MEITNTERGILMEDKINVDEIVEDIKELNNTHDHTQDYGSQDIDEGKLMSILAYISVLVLIPLFVSKSKYVRYHTNQGLVLFGAELVWNVLFGIVSGILGGIPLIGILVGIIGWLANLVFIVVSILGIVNVINGRAKNLPVIGKIRILK